jgi:hypothetical protein
MLVRLIGFAVLVAATAPVAEAAWQGLAANPMLATPACWNVIAASGTWRADPLLSVPLDGPGSEAENSSSGAAGIEGCQRE